MIAEKTKLSSDRGHIARHTDRMTDVLEFPSEHPEFVDRELPLKCKPGVFAAELYPAREKSAGGIYLPSRGGGWGSEGAAAERVRPDCVMVQSVGPMIEWDDPYKPRKMWSPHIEEEREELRSWEQVRNSAMDLARSLEVGDRIMVRPWSGVRYEEAFGVKGLCFFGQTDLWEEDAVMRWVPDVEWSPLESKPITVPTWNLPTTQEGAPRLARGSWRPLTNWAVIKLDKVTQGTVIVSSVPILDVTGTVLDAGPLCSRRPGDRVVVSDDMPIQSDDDRKWLTTKWGAWGEDVWLVREVCQNGIRRIVAELG